MATHKDGCINDSRMSSAVEERVDRVAKSAAYIAGGIAVAAFPEVVAGVLIGIGLFKLVDTMVDAITD